MSDMSKLMDNAPTIIEKSNQTIRQVESVLPVDESGKRINELALCWRVAREISENTSSDFYVPHTKLIAKTCEITGCSIDEAEGWFNYTSEKAAYSNVISPREAVRGKVGGQDGFLWDRLLYKNYVWNDDPQKLIDQQYMERIEKVQTLSDGQFVTELKLSIASLGQAK